jgi:putative DNA-invertase from lambdoid prophage Rac
MALEGEGVRVHCLALGGVDLTSPAGKMTMAVIAAVAEFERDLLVERTQAGLARARAEGRSLGRPAVLTDDQKRAVLSGRAEGASLGNLAKQFGVSRSAIQRVEKEARAAAPA